MSDKRFGGRKATPRRKGHGSHPKPDAGASSGSAGSRKRRLSTGSWGSWSGRRAENQPSEASVIDSILARYPFTLQQNSHGEYRLWPNDKEEEMTAKVHSTSHHCDHGRTEYATRNSDYFRNLRGQQKNKEEPTVVGLKGLALSVGPPSKSLTEPKKLHPPPATTASMELENLPRAMQNLHIRMVLTPSSEMLNSDMAVVDQAGYPIIRQPFVPTKETSAMPMTTAEPVSVFTRNPTPITKPYSPIVQKPWMSTMVRSPLQLPLGTQMSPIPLWSPPPSLAGPSQAQMSSMPLGSTAPAFAESPQQLPLGAQMPPMQSGSPTPAFSWPPASAFAWSPDPTFERPPMSFISSLATPPVPLVRAPPVPRMPPPPGLAPTTPVWFDRPTETAPDLCRPEINETASTVLASTLGIYQYVNDY